MDIIFAVFKLLIVLSIVATTHEFGHYIFAKIFKMKVNEFSIGFGPIIYATKEDNNKTRFSIRCIPLGGFCAIEGEDKETTSNDSFGNKKPWQRIVVLIAGVLFNTLLATVIFLTANFYTDTYTSQITNLPTTSPAYQAGLRDLDVITKIGNKRINIAEDILLYKNTSNPDIEITYIRDKKENTVIVKDAIKTIGYIGIYFNSNKVDDKGNILSYIETTEPGKPASEAKIKTNDKITKINNVETKTSIDVINMIYLNPNKEVTIEIERDNELIIKKLIPEERKIFNLGILDFSLEKTNIKYSYYKSINTISQIVGSYSDLFTGKVGVKQLSGIIGVGEVVSRASNFMEFLTLLGMISLAIGVANLIPFPPLDGGKVILVLIEWVTKKKIPLRIEEIISYIGFIILIILTIYVTVNDIIRIV